MISQPGVQWTMFARKPLLIFGAVSVIVAGLTFILAWNLSPWYDAANVRVRLHMSAPAETKINICWDRSQTQCLPLVPYLGTQKRVAEDGEIADMWLSELPARSTYSVSLVFKSGIPQGTFQDLELGSSGILLWGAVPGYGVQDTKFELDMFDPQHFTYTPGDNVAHVHADPGGQLVLTRDIQPGPTSFSRQATAVEIWGLLLSFYMLFAIPLSLLPFAVQNTGGIPLHDAPPRQYPWWVYILCGLATILILLLATNSPVMFNDYDPMYYLRLAIHSDWLSPARPPGYWIFLALIFWMFHYHLEGVVLVQAALLAASTMFCIWALRRWLHPIIATFAFYLVLFSPSQVHWMLFILRESLFASIVLLAVTAAIAHFTTGNPRASRIWMVVYVIASGLALLVRENGILMPVILLPVLIPEAIKRLTSSGMIWQRVRSVFLLFIRYAVAIVGTAAVYLGLSAFHYRDYGYFQFTIHVTSHHYTWEEIATSSFDSRSLLMPDRSISTEAKSYLGPVLYRSFIVAREQTPDLDPIFTSLFPTINQMTTERGQVVNWFHSASIIDQIGRSANTLLSRKAVVVGLLRQYRQFVVSKSDGYTPLLDDATGLAHKRELLAQLGKDLQYDGRVIQTNSAIDDYFHVADEYGWYRPLFILALLASLYLLRFDHPVFLAPMCLFLVNALLMILLRTEYGRYIEGLDVLLILQAALGLSRLTYAHLFTVAPGVPRSGNHG